MTDSTRFWTAEREALLRQMYPTATWEAMQVALGKTQPALTCKAFKLGLVRVKESRRVKRTCVKCACEFEIYASTAKNAPAKFCSDSCKLAAWADGEAATWAERRKKSCERCGTSFEVLASAEHHRRFCSQECMIQWRDAPERANDRVRVGKVPLRCQWCSNGMERWPSQIKAGRGRFCSKECNGAWCAQNQVRESQLERNFAERLRQAGLVFETQFKFRHYVLDIAFPEIKLAVEVDGDYWHTLPNIIEKDKRKDSALLSAGWRVLHIWEKEIRSALPYALQRVFDAV